jgi:hypothetical protein
MNIHYVVGIARRNGCELHAYRGTINLGMVIKVIAAVGGAVLLQFGLL